MADQRQNKNQPLDAGQLALRCAQFFIALGESCLQFSQKYNKQKERKTKLIKKAQKQRLRPTKRAQGQGEDVNQQMRKKLPKKPLTAYIIYFQQKKPNFVEKYPGLNLSDLTKLIAKQWKQIDNNQRKPYLAQAHEDRKRYDNQMKQFKLKYGAVTTNNYQQQQPASVLLDQNQHQQLEQQKLIESNEKKSQRIQQQGQIQAQAQGQGQGQGEGQAQAQGQGEGQGQGQGYGQGQGEEQKQYSKMNDEGQQNQISQNENENYNENDNQIESSNK